MISGSIAMARARPTRFRMPPESSAGFLARMFSGNPTSASRAETTRRISSALLRVCCRSGKPTFWAIVMLSNSAACWKRKPKRIRWRVSSRSPKLGQVAAVEVDRAAGGPQQPDDRLQQHGLAAAALADDGQRLAARNRQADVAQHALPAEMDFHGVQPDRP